MKVFAAVLLAVVLCVYGTSVCVPSPNQVQTQSWDDQRTDYIDAVEILDVSANSFRRTDVAFSDSHHHHRPNEYAQDMLVLAAQQLTYIVQGIPGNNNSFTCRKIQGANTIKDPCFTHNGTKVETDVIGTSTVDNFFAQDDHHHVPIYSRIMITPTGIPVSLSTWGNMGSQDALFANFNTTIPTNAFAVNPICNQKATTTTMTLEQYLKQQKVDMRLRWLLQ